LFFQTDYAQYRVQKGLLHISLESPLNVPGDQCLAVVSVYEIAQATEQGTFALASASLGRRLEHPASQSGKG
jgi:hypothetical protein